MTEEISFEAYLSISPKKFGIYLLDIKNLKNIYKEELHLENNTVLIDYILLKSFLDKNVFKIEKLIGNFLKNIAVIIENNQILSFSIGIYYLIIKLIDPSITPGLSSTILFLTFCSAVFINCLSTSN